MFLATWNQFSFTAGNTYVNYYEYWRWNLKESTFSQTQWGWFTTLRSKILFAELVGLNVITVARWVDIVLAELNIFLYLKQH